MTIHNDQVEYIPGMQGWGQHLQINLCDTDINKMSDKNLMIISIGPEKAFGKIQHPLMKKISQRSGYRRDIHQHNKSHI